MTHQKIIIIIKSKRHQGFFHELKRVQFLQILKLKMLKLLSGKASIKFVVLFVQ